MMAGQGRREPRQAQVCAQRWLYLGVTTLFWLVAPAQSTVAQAIDWPIPDSWQSDAELTDLFFIDAQRGWVVGERGTVLRTENGGADWQAVHLGTSCRLESVFFLDDQNGWIAGGYYTPRASSSRAVMFRTSNGGQSWQEVRSLTIPKLNMIRFESVGDGWALGDADANHPAGLYTTTDGGKTWSSRAASKLSHWSTGDRMAGRRVMAGQDGSLAVEDHELKTAYTPETPDVRIARMRMFDQRHGLAIGNHGACLSTRNGGLSWHPDPRFSDVPGGRAFDFRAMSRSGAQIWIGGNPGTHIFRASMNSAQPTQAGDAKVPVEWAVAQTPLRGGVNQIFFVDSSHGWAVGQTGEIVATQDGGQTWVPQRAGLKQLGVLQIVRHPSQICAEVFANFCAESGYYGGVLVLPDDGISVTGPQLDAARQACARLGVSFLDVQWIGAATDVATDRLVARIRLMRPAMIAIPGDNQSTTTAGFRSLIIDAVHAAADGNAFASQLDRGLAPHDVDRLLVHHRGSLSQHKISANQFLTGHGCLMGDYVTPSRILLGQNELDDRPVSLSIIYSSARASASSDLMYDNPAARRAGKARAAGNLALMRQVARKNETLAQLVEFPVDSSQAKSRWLRQVSESITVLDDATAGMWLHQLADRCAQRGSGEQAAEVYSYLVRRYDKHPLTVTALRWLYRHYISEEKAVIHQRVLRQAPTIVRPDNGVKQGGSQTRPVSTVENGVVKTVWQPVEPAKTSTENDPRQSGVQAAEHAALVDIQIAELPRKRYQQAKLVARTIGLHDFGATRSQPLLLSQVLLNRKLDPGVAIDNQLKSVASQKVFVSTANAAKREMQLAGSATGTVEFHVHCNRANRPPKLDGQLDEPFWQSIHGRRSVALQPAGTRRDVVRMASDEDFFYIAAACKKHSGLVYESTGEPRKRDANLSQRDRLEIALDIDRDSATFFLLAIDSAGRVAESCGGNLAWNPTWYIAQREDNEFWYVEAAIPLDEISNADTQTHWGLSIRRFARHQLLGSWPHASVKDSAAAQVSTDGPDMPSLYQLAISRNHALAAQTYESFGVLTLPQQDADPGKDKNAGKTKN